MVHQEHCEIERRRAPAKLPEVDHAGQLQLIIDEEMLRGEVAMTEHWLWAFQRGHGRDDPQKLFDLRRAQPGLAQDGRIYFALAQLGPRHAGPIWKFPPAISL